MNGCIKCGDEITGDGTEDKDFALVCDWCEQNDSD